MKVVSIVGMTGSGKSEVAAEFERNGFTRIRFGDITDEEVGKRGLPLNEENERAVRESLRREHGMAAYAVLNKPKIDTALKTSDVVIDGLYSWEEYLYLKETYGKAFLVIAVWASPEVRYSRLAGREKRGLTREEAASRDKAEIENVNKGGPIAMADITILNEFSLDTTKEVLAPIIAGLKNE
jgi:dephospho-CoA kinase